MLLHALFRGSSRVGAGCLASRFSSAASAGLLPPTRPRLVAAEDARLNTRISRSTATPSAAPTGSFRSPEPGRFPAPTTFEAWTTVARQAKCSSFVCPNFFTPANEDECQMPARKRATTEEQRCEALCSGLACPNGFVPVSDAQKIACEMTSTARRSSAVHTLLTIRPRVVSKEGPPMSRIMRRSTAPTLAAPTASVRSTTHGRLPAPTTTAARITVARPSDRPSRAQTPSCQRTKQPAMLRPRVHPRTLL